MIGLSEINSKTREIKLINKYVRRLIPPSLLVTHKDINEITFMQMCSSTHIHTL